MLLHIHKKELIISVQGATLPTKLMGKIPNCEAYQLNYLLLSISWNIFYLFHTACTDFWMAKKQVTSNLQFQVFEGFKGT
jgi:hypothetical protein